MLAQIRSFLTVVEEGNLHRAAARLHISQLTLLRQMQVLELELGGRLLERIVTGVRPTAGGQALAEKTGALLASYDLAMSAIRGELSAGRRIKCELLTSPVPSSSTFADRCKKYGEFRPKFHGPAQSLGHAAFELIANENAVHILPGYARHHSPPGVVILPLEDAEVTWKIVVTWRRGRTGGALKASLDALFAKVTPEAKRQGWLPTPSLRAGDPDLA